MKSRRISRSFLRRTSVNSLRRQQTSTITTPRRTGSIGSDLNTFDERDFETTRLLMNELIDEIQIDKTTMNFDQNFLHQDDVIGCLLRIFNSIAEDHDDQKRIHREQMLKLIEDSDLFDQQLTPTIFLNDWNFLRRNFIRNQIYERKMKTFDFVGFLKCLEMISRRLHRSKDEVIKKILSTPIYDDLIRLKEIRDKIHLGFLPTMETILHEYQQMQIKDDERKPTKKKKKKKRKKTKSTRLSIPIEPTTIVSENLDSSAPISTKEATQLKTLVYFEPYLIRDDLDKDLMNKLFEMFKLGIDPLQPGYIPLNILIEWFRAARVISHSYANNLIEGILEGILARNIDAGRYKRDGDALEWIAFLDCIRQLAKQTSLSQNDIVKKLLVIDEFSFEKWRKETTESPEIGSTIKSNRPWDPKKVLAAVTIMRDIIEESRKLHLTDDERKRLRSLYKEFAAFAYRRQSSHLEARLTNSVLSNWMRECRIFDDKYTVNELDKDFISILGDLTLNGLYSPGTRDIDFDGFLLLIQTIAAHKHIRADDLVQMIFVGPRSPLQKSAEFNEHMDRTKIQTS